MDEILSDTSKFEQLSDVAVKLTLKRKNQVMVLLKKLKSNNCITEKTYNELHPTGTRIGILYGLPKIHKPSSLPFRSILSCINHYLYKIAKFFIPFLTPISMSSFIIKDSFSFAQELLNSDLNTDNVVMASSTLLCCSPTFLSMKQLRLSLIISLPTLCITKALIA